MPSDFEIIFQALEDARVRYLTVGGVAVVGRPKDLEDIRLLALTPEERTAASHGEEDG